MPIYIDINYRKISNANHGLVGDKLVDPSDVPVVGTSCVRATPTTSSFLT